MASGTVGYTDTRGNKDYLSIIANQVGKRLKQSSDMAAEERAFAEEQAEAGGTSLSEAGIGRGYFFKRALGSRFGGDAIARTKGRMGVGGAGTDPTGNFKSRFRGGFDYNVVNEIQQSTLPLSSALSAGLRGVESGLTEISQSLDELNRGINNLAAAQADAARQAILNGAFMQAFLSHMRREGARQRARAEERGLERGSFFGGSGSGGRGKGIMGGRGMINVTPPTGNVAGGAANTLGAATSFGTSQLLGKNTKTIKGIKKTAQAVAKTGPGAAKAVKATKLLPSGSAKVTKGVGKLTQKGGTRVIATASKLIGVEPTKKLLEGTKQIAKKARKIPVRTLAGAMLGAKRMNQMNPLANVLEYDKMVNSLGIDEMAEFTAKKANEAMKLGENFVNMKMYGKGTATSVDDAAKLYASLLDGSMLGKPLAPKVAEDLMKNYVSPDVYGKFTRAANKPLKQAMKGTFTHKMLKAPGIPKAIASGGAKTAAKTGGKALLKSGLKKIPVIAGLAGIAFGIQRAMEGDLMGAGLEITSGILGATGVGGGLGLAIDGFLLGRDLGMMPMKHGGILTGETNVVAGEAGDEAFTPLTGAQGMIAGSVFGEASAESLVNFFAKRTNKGALPKSLLEAYPNLDPTNARDYMKLKRLQKESDFVYSGANNPSEGANVLNEASAKAGNGGFVSMPTTVINNYNAVAQGNSGSGTTGTSAFPSDYAVFAANYSLASKA